MLSALTAWFFLSTFFSPTAIKAEPTQRPKPELSDSELLDPFSTEDLSDTPRSFPTLGRQMPPLQYPPPSRRGLNQQEPVGGNIKDEEDRPIKKEEKEEEGELPLRRSSGNPPTTVGAEADDEDEDDDDVESAAWRDSGIGTGLDDADRNMGVHQRRRALFGGRGRE